MDLSTLTIKPGNRKQRKRVGRGPGSGNGKTAGRGHKGQKSRSGYHKRRGFEGGQMPLNRRLPKRGFTRMKRRPLAEINVDVLEKAFESGAEVTVETILKRGLAKEAPGGVKVLGRGDLTKSLTVRVNAVSPSAQKKIEAAGGQVQIVGIPGKEDKQAEASAAPGGTTEEK